MARKSYPLIVFALLFLLITGGTVLASKRHRQRSHHAGQPGAFDYYVLALSWSPEFCHGHPSKPECTSGHYGFVVHGLWPQYESGYPENCSNAAGPADTATLHDIMPDASLVQHEWATHGTCSGLDAKAYFKLMRQAFQLVNIPAQLKGPTRMFRITPQALKEQFVSANPRLKAEDVAIGCGNNYLTGISVCMDKQLQPRACEGLRDCRANVIRVPPVHSGN